MDLDGFKTSLGEPVPPPGLSLALQTLWWDAKGDWSKAHECAQADTQQTGSLVHAYLHRKEPDLANARYWYARAGRAPATASLDDEWTALATELLST